GRPARSLESRWWRVAIVALATTLRAAHVLSLRATPWFDHLVVDPEYCDEWARRLAAGGWLGERPFYMDPLYPYFLGVIYRLCGRDLLLVRLVQVALGAGSCALVAVIGRRVGGAAIGALAALGFALYAPAGGVEEPPSPVDPDHLAGRPELLHRQQSDQPLGRLRRAALRARQ